MTRRLYYDQPALEEFESVVEDVLPPSAEQPRAGIILRETAFYPTSGGQLHDTGWLTLDSSDRFRVTEVAEREDGRIVHYLEAPVRAASGTMARGIIDSERRRDHMQQYSVNLVLSAAFV